MSVKTYVTKPVTIEACQWEGGNFKEIEEFTGENNIVWIESGDLKIATLEGVMTASVQDYVIKGLRGEFYSCKPDVFEKKYEEVGNV